MLTLKKNLCTLFYTSSSIFLKREIRSNYFTWADLCLEVLWPFRFWGLAKVAQKQKHSPTIKRVLDTAKDGSFAILTNEFHFLGFLHNYLSPQESLFRLTIKSDFFSDQKKTTMTMMMLMRARTLFEKRARVVLTTRTDWKQINEINSTCIYSKIFYYYKF